MYDTGLRWLQSRPFEHQILLIVVVLDPIGFVAGYLLAPSFGVEPLVGGVYGLVAASMPSSWWVLRRAHRHA